MIIRALNTCFGSTGKRALGESISFEMDRTDSVSVAYISRAAAESGWRPMVGLAAVALVLDEERYYHVARKFFGDAGTSPSPIGRISSRKPDWKPVRSEGNYYDEFIVDGPRHWRGWVKCSSWSALSDKERADIRAEMRRRGLKEM